MLHNKINYKRNLSWVLVQNRQITDTATKSSHYTFMVHLERFQCKTAITIEIFWKIWSSEVVIWACFMPDQSSSPQTDMSLLRHIDYPDSLLFLLNSAYLAEKQADPNFIVDGFTRPVIKSMTDRLSNPWSTTLEASTLITSARYNVLFLYTF